MKKLAISEKEKKMFNQRFEQKWKAFKQFDSMKFERCHIRVVRKKDGLILLRSDTTLDYIQIRLTDKKQLNAICNALKKDKKCKIW